MSKWVKHWGKQIVLLDALKTSIMLFKIRKAHDYHAPYVF